MDHKNKNYKSLRKKQKSFDLELGNGFLDMTSKACQKKKK